MPMEPNDRIWGSLFGACRMDIGFGDAIGKHLIEMEPDEPGFYVLFANLYASTGRWKDALTVRGTIVDPLFGIGHLRCLVLHFVD
ncbi:hypothetical protein KFK09_028182 [Dendrobium nobile]|uniref:Uncharacterized protein n=1 Tax=Dendrobium nobile TaxID=94219 RepID=A0A8T3A6Q6_DENNO|nr:hypothetical protein KFK09_028182 [Dendrobium nobile]